MLRIILVSMVSIAIVGCAGEPQRKSVALQVSEAGGVSNLRDVSQAEIQKAYRDKQMTGTYFGVTGLGVATGVFDPTTNASQGVESAALFVMAFLLSGHQASDFSRMFVWMPETEATSPSEAMMKMRQIVTDAYKHALPDSGINLVLEKVHRDKGLLFGGGTQEAEKVYIAVNDLQCPQRTIGIGCKAYIRAIERLPKLKIAPNVLGGGKAYVWEGDSADILGYPSTISSGSHEKDGEEVISVFQRISKSLPPWVYFYMSPTRLGYPLVLNQGQRLYFIEPEKVK